jgi:hypothetical protein
MDITDIGHERTRKRRARHFYGVDTRFPATKKNSNFLVKELFLISIIIFTQKGLISKGKNNRGKQHDQIKKKNEETTWWWGYFFEKNNFFPLRFERARWRDHMTWTKRI